MILPLQSKYNLKEWKKKLLDSNLNKSWLKEKNTSKKSEMEIIMLYGLHWGKLEYLCSESVQQRT